MAALIPVEGEITLVSPPETLGEAAKLMGVPPSSVTVVSDGASGFWYGCRLGTGRPINERAHAWRRILWAGSPQEQAGWVMGSALRGPVVYVSAEENEAAREAK